MKRPSAKDLTRAWADNAEGKDRTRRGKQQEEADFTIGPPRDRRVKIIIKKSK